MTFYVANAFSVGMLTHSESLHFALLDKNTELSVPEDFVSCVGHADTAAVFSSILGIEVPMNRVSITLKKGDYLLVGTPNQRFPEGATELPKGAHISWVFITGFEGGFYER